MNYKTADLLDALAQYPRDVSMGYNGQYLMREAAAEIKALRDELESAKKDAAMFDHAACCLDELAGKLQAENADLKAQLTWRTWPDEKPEKEAFYLCDVDGGQHVTLFYCPKIGNWHLDDLTELPKTSWLNSWLPIPKGGE